MGRHVRAKGFEKSCSPRSPFERESCEEQHDSFAHAYRYRARIPRVVPNGRSDVRQLIGASNSKTVGPPLSA